MARNDEPNWGHILGLGLQVAVGAGLGIVVGSWLDRRFPRLAPLGLLGCMMLGLAGGLYLLIKEAMRANKD